MSEIACLRCKTAMETGFLLDVAQGVRQQRWYPGIPEKRFFGDLNVKRDQLIYVMTYRCPSCGYLESYAK